MLFFLFFFLICAETFPPTSASVVTNDHEREKALPDLVLFQGAGCPLCRSCSWPITQRGNHWFTMQLTIVQGGLTHSDENWSWKGDESQKLRFSQFFDTESSSGKHIPLDIKAIFLHSSYLHSYLHEEASCTISFRDDSITWQFTNTAIPRTYNKPGWAEGEWCVTSIPSQMLNYHSAHFLSRLMAWLAHWFYFPLLLWSYNF